ncbi:MAG: response regulator [Elusimicrobia bacterium]|nr:response regulator [Elusimicrobiota bacterium]
MAKILIVDDERDVVALIRFLLEKDAHQVFESYNGADALEALKGMPEKPDLIILDIMMPVMDGYTVNTRLQDDRTTASIPVMVLTAKGQMKDLFQHAPNVAAYMEKPFDPKVLREKVRTILGSGKQTGGT